jgi:ubiquinone/menaquinone biosynthesis C-methylase UbiE
MAKMNSRHRIVGARLLNPKWKSRIRLVPSGGGADLAAHSEPVAKAGEVEWQKNWHFYHELEPGTLFMLNPELPNFARRLYLEAFGGEYPADEATDGYITRSELREMVGRLHAGPGQKIADLGCGRGGPGQWIARATGVELVGIDFSAVALEQARARARRLGINNSYQSASFDATGLDPASVDGAISIDVIWAIPDKRAGFAETARILKSGARFVFTDWERDLSPPGYPAPVSDHRPLLQATGFEVELRQLRPYADSQRRSFYEKMLARQGELMREVDEKTAESILREARAWLGLLDGVDYLQHSRRVLVAARKLAEK